MTKRKYRNVSKRVVCGVKPGETIREFPPGTNVRALELAGSIRPVPRQVRKPAKDTEAKGDDE